MRYWSCVSGLITWPSSSSWPACGAAWRPVSARVVALERSGRENALNRVRSDDEIEIEHTSKPSSSGSLSGGRRETSGGKGANDRQALEASASRTVASITSRSNGFESAAYAPSALATSR